MNSRSRRTLFIVHVHGWHQSHWWLPLFTWEIFFFVAQIWTLWHSHKCRLSTSTRLLYIMRFVFIFTSNSMAEPCGLSKWIDVHCHRATKWNRDFIKWTSEKNLFIHLTTSWRTKIDLFVSHYRISRIQRSLACFVVFVVKNHNFPASKNQFRETSKRLGDLFISMPNRPTIIIYFSIIT